MSKKISLGATVALAAVAVAVTFCVTVNVMTARFNDQLAQVSELRNRYSALQELETCVNGNAYYMPEEDLRDDSIGQAYAAALRAAGDAYARYLTAEEFAENNRQNDGLSDGLGLTLILRNEEAYVYNVVQGSPAKEAGFLPGDVVLSVADGEGKTTTIEDGYETLVEALRGGIGEERTVNIRRGEDKTKSISVVSAEYSAQTVWLEMEGSIAVVHIDGFKSDTDETFITLMDTLAADSTVTGVVFDLRNNGGGLLDTVTAMLDRLLPEGVIVTQVDREGKTVSSVTSDATSFDKPMAVLVNGSCASASELFACALRDYGKAKLVGTETYGKGCVQTTFSLSDGSAICFTTALYNPPSSGNFDGKPLVPDVVVALTEEQSLSLYSLTAETDPQLAAALALLPGGTPLQEPSKDVDNGSSQGGSAA